MNSYNVITLFPNLIEEWKNTGIINQALKNNLVAINSTNLRDFGIGTYKQVDDAPYGGGPGMVLMPEPLDKAITSSKADINVFLTPSGQQLNENLISELLEYNKNEVSLNISDLEHIDKDSFLYYFLRDYGFVDWDKILNLIDGESGKKIFSKSHSNTRI